MSTTRFTDLVVGDNEQRRAKGKRTSVGAVLVFGKERGRKEEERRMNDNGEFHYYACYNKCEINTYINTIRTKFVPTP